MSESFKQYDAVFIESVVEEINEMLLERYGDDDTVPMLGVVDKERIPGDVAIWLHVFRTEDVKNKMSGK